MKKLLLGFLILVSSASYAVDPIDFGTATPAEVRSYNLKRQQEYIQKTDKSFADFSKQIDQVKASVNGSSIKQTLERSGVLSDGSKVNVKTVVTQPVDKTKVAKTLTERLKNAKDHAKNVGKASIPSFVGMAAFTALMEGIDYVMGEGGKIQKPNPELLNATTLKPYHEFKYTVFTGTSQEFASVNAAFNAFVSASSQNQRDFRMTTSTCSQSGSVGACLGSFAIYGTWKSTGNEQLLGYISKYRNPQYNPSAINPNPPYVDITDQQLETSLRNALSNNNPALAAAIADAIKSSYSYDGSEGQKPSSNTLAKEAADDMAVALPKAFDNPVPTSDPERPSGYAKITDGEKTLEAYVTPAPIGGTTDTTTTPNIDPVTGQPTGETSTSGGFQFPKFCDWAAVVCDWIEWTKEPPEEEKELDVPVSEIDKQDIKKDLITVAASACPPDQRFDVSGLPFGISINKSYSMQPICNTLEPLKYLFQLMTFCLCAFMLLRI